MINYFKDNALAIIVSILFIDALFYVAWALSGQHPVDGFYFGTITGHIIGLFN